MDTETTRALAALAASIESLQGKVRGNAVAHEKANAAHRAELGARIDDVAATETGSCIRLDTKIDKLDKALRGEISGAFESRDKDRGNLRHTSDIHADQIGSLQERLGTIEALHKAAPALLAACKRAKALSDKRAEGRCKWTAGDQANYESLSAAIANATPSQATKVQRTSFGGNHPLGERS